MKACEHKPNWKDQELNWDVENEKDRFEDDRFHIPKTIPSYLRIDLDVKNGLINLQKLIREYA
jgi:hypothetical protein